jgi:hypothetical protein
LPALLDKAPGFRTPRITGEKDHPATEGRQLPLEQPVQGAPIECGHLHVTQDQIKAPLMQQGECLLTVRGGLDAVPIALE